MSTVVYRAGAVIAAGQHAIFEVSGVVLLEGMVGRVTDTVVSNDSTSIVALGPGWSLNGRTAGYLLGQTVSDANVEPMIQATPQVLGDGFQVKLWQQGTDPEGSIEWALWYTALTDGAEVTAV